MTTQPFYARNGLNVAGLTTIDGTTGQVAIGANTVLTNSGVSLGNATVNVAISSTQVKNGSVTINGTTLTVGANVSITTSAVVANVVSCNTSTVSGTHSVGQMFLQNINTNNIIAGGANSFIYLQPNNAAVSAMVWAPNGSVGIQVAPSDTFHVAGNIIASGDITTSFSDVRLKDHLYDIENVLEKLKDIIPFAYVPSAELLALDPGQSTAIKFGVSAQAIQRHFPEIVSIAPFDMNEDKSSKSGHDYLTLDYKKLIPVLLQGIRELDDKYQDLKKRIEKLEG